MYFPILRGRQYELIALRELAEASRISNRIIPVIEPVKFSPTLLKTLESFIGNYKNIALVHNPQVGVFRKELSVLKDDTAKYRFDGIHKSRNLIHSHIINRHSKMELHELTSSGVEMNEIITINMTPDYLDYNINYLNDAPPKWNIIPDERSFKHKVRRNKVLLNDHFIKQDRNTDYAKHEDRFFSADHLYFEEEGFLGFSDFSIVGSEYSESGFAPFAIAIHIVYFDSEKNLRIKHFVSDSNDDISDQANKFYEAVSKLANWVKGQKISTLGLDRLLEHQKNGTYPGLGTIKKLAIMHHLELVDQYFSEVDEG